MTTHPPEITPSAKCAPPASAMFPGVLLSTPALRGDSAMKEIAEIFAI
jgi:hypothetical protein